MALRQLSFLGTTDYKIATYVFDEARRETCFVAEAIAATLLPAEVVLLATEPAWKKHGDAASSAIRAACPAAVIRRVALTNGSNATEQWGLFTALRAELNAAEGIDQVVLDVTHGWRVQPLIAAAVVAYHRAIEESPLPLRVLYGAFSEVGESPVWDLTAFLDLVDWGHGLRTLLETGRADLVVAAAEPIAKRHRKEWAQGGRSGPGPALGRLVAALQDFSDHLATVRTGDLLGPGGSAAKLREAISAARGEVAARLPPLDPVLDRVAAQAAPLAAAGLGDPGDTAAMAALARLYLELDRLLEAITVTREGRISEHATPEGRRPGAQGAPVDASAFASARASAERAWIENDPNGRSLSQVRNTLSHAGFQAEPLGAAMVRRQVDAHVQSGARTRFVNLTNHPSAGWEAEQREAAGSLAADLVDLPFPEVPPDAGNVSAIAEQVVAELPSGTTHALVQGEMVLVAELVPRLQALGIVCVAATTRRVVEAAEDGRKLSQFQFVRFRAYPHTVLES